MRASFKEAAAAPVPTRLLGVSTSVLTCPEIDKLKPARPAVDRSPARLA